MNPNRTMSAEQKLAGVQKRIPTSVLKGPDIDKGWAWVSLLASFLTMALIGSSVPLIGILYLRHLETFGKGAAVTACIGSLMSSLLSFCGPLAGWVCSRFGRRVCVIIGGILTSLSLAISSQAYNFWVVFVTNGIIAGIGFGLVTTPGHINVGCYFVRRRHLASGLYVTGFPIGIFLATPFLQYLEHKFGWRGALLIYAGVQLNLCVTGVVMRPSSLETRPDKIETSVVEVKHNDKDDHSNLEIETKAEKQGGVYTNVPFYFAVIAFAFTNCSINIVYVHLQRYVYMQGSTEGDVRMLYLAFSISGILSKLLTGLGTGDIKNGKSLDKMCLLLGSFGIVAAVMFAFPHFAHAQAYRLIGLCLIGFYYNVEPPMYVPYSIQAVGFANLNDAIGFIHLGIGVGFLIGPPIAAYITDLTNNYDSAFYVAGSVNVLAALSLVIMILLMKPRPKTIENQDSNLCTEVDSKLMDTKPV